MIRRASICTRGALVALATVGIFPHLATPATAQERYDRPPEEGGYVYQLGMPPIWKTYAGGTVGWYRPGEATDQLLALGHMGVYKDLLTPVAGIAALGLEGYGGFRGEEGIDGGGRAVFSIPTFGFGTGVDYNISDDDWSWLLRLDIPFRRSGILGRGSVVRFDYLPGFDHTFAVGLSAPIGGRNVGATRPQRDAVELRHPPVQRIEWAERPAGLDEAIERLREGALWIAELAMPFTDQDARDPVESYAAQIARVQEHVARVDERFPRGRTALEETRVFHDELDRAFSMVVGGTAADGTISEEGRRVADAARRTLLVEVLMPYDRLLGQRKSHDGLDLFIAGGNAEFGRWLLQDSELHETRYRDVYWMFQTLGEIVEEVRRFQLERWHDNRLVWLPLQLALRAEDHDENVELLELIELGTGSTFSGGNRTHYVMNEEFQFEFLRSVHEARQYHVLWIHDYRGNNGKGEPDEIAFRQTVRGYLTALADRIENYDQTREFTQYFLFLDQNYFEANNSRLFFRVLENPLEYELDLPAGYESWEEELRAVQDRLRSAVANSLLLQTERAQFGDDWLRNRVRVHINITNPSDFSFSSLHVMGLMPIPDNIMRDHRKIAFYDITEEDPYRGRAMFTGMGIGEHYTGPNWEDRAMVIHGPAALPVKDAARALLEQQGFLPGEIPIPLRRLDRPDNYQASVDSLRALMTEALGADPGLVLQVHNRTGYAQKPIDVEKAILYSLMPAGSLLKVPDSLWQSYPYASLLLGSALRGCDVLIIAPAARSAPSAAGPTLARAHGMLSGLIEMRNELEPLITDAGGILKIGLYTPDVGVGDLAGRVRQGRSHRDPWLAKIYPPNPAIAAVADSVVEILDAAGYTGDYLVASDSAESPKLHMKANIFITRQVWLELMRLPEWGPVMREYVKYLAAELGPTETRTANAEVAPELIAAQRDLTQALGARITSQEDRRRGMAFFTIGSVNMDYRSMVMDGEVMITLNGWNTLSGLADFLLIAGLSEWIDTQEELDALLPPPSGLNRTLANFGKLAL